MSRLKSEVPPFENVACAQLRRGRADQVYLMALDLGVVRDRRNLTEPHKRVEVGAIHFGCDRIECRELTVNSTALSDERFPQRLASTRARCG